MSAARIYASFDVFPSPKGAATHIAAFASGLAARFGELDLLTVEAGPGALRHAQPLDPGIRHVPIPVTGKNMIERVLNFRRGIAAYLGPPSEPADWVHVRSIYEGYPIAVDKRARARRLIFEVNGLPSIELKYHYPKVAEDRELLHKLHRQEARTLHESDLIVTPSKVTAAHLRNLGVPTERIAVIPNGVHLELFPFAPPPEREEALRLIYAGTLTAWQGVYVALEALRLYRRDHPATLTMVGPAKKKQRQKILSKAYDMGLSDALTLLPALPRPELAALHQRHDVSLAPLLANDRNLVQGCCPLKVLETMATGTPLLASDLPVVRDLCGDEEALLVKPGVAKSLKDGLLQIRADPAAARQRAGRARARIEREFTWERSLSALCEAYEAMG